MPQIAWPPTPNGAFCTAAGLFSAGCAELALRLRKMSPGAVSIFDVNYQSLYRRYRPQRFGDVLGQDHVSATLRNAVLNNKVAHAYLFSGPRGCGKTTNARILAKALNCTNLQGGEPCGECESCVLVQSGTSLDVIELDAASNNGVDTMRELVSRAALGTAGRRKVYIVDEVHMLSTAASNALLKTLEEPPDHVVFVLATTDPQKVLPTIRSRTQPFEFRLFSFNALLDLVKSVAADAKIDLDEATLEAVARKGAGSARDALSALDQAAAAGGIDDVFDISELADAIAGGDSGPVLIAVDRAIERGRDPRQLARDLIELLRSVFLIHMGRSGSASDLLVRSLSPAAATRGIETVGEALVAMRDAVEPRVVLEVALMRLVRPELDRSVAALQQRVEALERSLADGKFVTGGGPSPAAPNTVAPAISKPRVTRPAPDAAVAPARESTSLASSAAEPPNIESTAISEPEAGELAPGEVQAESSPELVATVAASQEPLPVDSTVSSPPIQAETSPRGLEGSELNPASTGPEVSPVANKLPTLRSTSQAQSSETAPKKVGAADAARAKLAPKQGEANRSRLPAAPGPFAQTATPTTQNNSTPSNPVPPKAPGPLSAESLTADHELILEALSSRARAIFRAARFVAVQGGKVSVAVPNLVHLGRSREHEAELQKLLIDRYSATVLTVFADDDASQHIESESAATSEPEPLSDEDDIDLSELVDAPAEAVKSTFDFIKAAFPGAELVE